MEERRPFFTRVESLRGIGALMVAGWHVSGWAVNGVVLLPHVPWENVGAVQNAIGRFVLALLAGHAALMVFFVISGCVLRVSLEYGPQTFVAGATRFLVARVFRIYPVIIVAVLVAALVHGWQVPPEAPGGARPLTASHLIANFLLLDASLNSTLWAIQLEAIMAPVIVVLYFVERQFGPRALVAVTLVATAMCFMNWSGWSPLSLYFFSFVLGMLAPTLGRQFVTGLSQPAARIWLVAAILALLLPGQLIGFFSRTSTVIEAYAAFVLVSMAAYRFDLRSLAWLDERPVRLLGMSSGSYYVLHMPLLAILVPIAAAVVPVAWSVNFPVLVGIGVILFSLAALAPIALLSFHLVEAPGIALGRQVIGQWRLKVAS